MLRISRLLPPAQLFLVCCTVLGYSSLSFAAQPATTVLPDAVLQSLLKPHQQSANPLTLQLNQHLQEAHELIAEAVEEDKLQQAGAAMRCHPNSNCWRLNAPTSPTCARMYKPNWMQLAPNWPSSN